MPQNKETVVLHAGKAIEISNVLSEPNVDLWKLRELALSEGGLVNGTFLLLFEHTCVE